MKEGDPSPGCEVFTLIVDTSEESQAAVTWLNDQGIPLYLRDVVVLPNGLPELTAPRLITPVGSFKGISSIRHYTASFHLGVISYLQNRV